MGVDVGLAKGLGRSPDESKAKKAPDDLASRDLVRARARAQCQGGTHCCNLERQGRVVRCLIS